MVVDPTLPQQGVALKTVATTPATAPQREQ
jgi:hypothetical protein